MMQLSDLLLQISAIEGIMGIHPSIPAIVGAAAYGYSHFLKHRWTGNDITNFDVWDFTTTILWSAAFGLGLWVIGFEPTEGNVGFLILQFAGAMTVFEAMVKAAFEKDRQRARAAGRATIKETVRSLLGLGTSRESVAESIERGGQETAEMTGKEVAEEREAREQEYQGEWSGMMPEEEALAQRDEYEGVEDPEHEYSSLGDEDGDSDGGDDEFTSP